MKDMIRTARNERGFTLSELLAAIVIMGCMSAVAVLAITRFLSTGTAEAANTEVHQANAAISACMVDAGVAQLDTSAPVGWDGTEGVVTATSAGGVVHDAADSLRNKRFKATYRVTPDGEITGVTAQEWAGVTWEDGSWKKNK